MKTSWLVGICLAIYSASYGYKAETPTNDEEVVPGLHSGLLFQPKGTLLLATGVWTAVIRFRHTDVQQQANMLQNQLRNITQALTDLHRTAKNGSDLEEIRNREYVGYMLDMWFRERNWMEAEIDEAEREIMELRTELRLSRRERALIPFVGDGLKWLFGTSTEKDTERLHHEIKGVRISIGKLHHITELQTTLIGALSKEQKTNQRNIALLAKKSAELEETVIATRNENYVRMRNIRREIDINQVVTSAIRTAGAAVMAFRHEVQKISQAMAHTQQGKVTPTILPPKKLKDTITDIQEHLPAGWTPAVTLTDTPADIYNALDIVAVATTGGWEVHIQIPLNYQTYGSFFLYKVKSIPTHFLNSSMAVETEAPAEYFAISNDQRLHIEAEERDIGHCKKIARKTICHKLSPLIQESREGCLYNAFRDNRAKADNYCIRRVISTSPQIYALTDRKWLYAFPQEELFAMQCSDDQEPTKGFRLQGTGVFSLPPGCAAMGDKYIVPAHLKVERKRIDSLQMDDLTHFKISLNLSALFNRLPVTKSLNQTALKKIMLSMPASDEEDPLLKELRRQVENWEEMPSEDMTDWSFYSHSSISISLGTIGVVGVIILMIILCRKRAGSNTPVIQPPQHIHTVIPPEQQNPTVLIGIRARLDRLEQDCGDLRTKMGEVSRLEDKLRELQRSYDEIAPLL